MKKSCFGCHANRRESYCALGFKTEVKNGGFGTDELVPKQNCTKPKNYKDYLRLLKLHEEKCLNDLKNLKQ